MAPFVVAVSGTSGSGKTTLVRGLASVLAGEGRRIACLHFDDYSGATTVPADLASWVERGADPDEWRTDGFVDDLLTYLGHDTEPQVAVVLLEEPFARARTSVGPLVDLALHLHLPLGVSLARRLLRDFLPALGDPGADGLGRLRGYLDRYLDGGGAAYEAIDGMARGTSDVVLDGLADPVDLVARARQEVEVRLARR